MTRKKERKEKNPKKKKKKERGCMLAHQNCELFLVGRPKKRRKEKREKGGSPTA